MGMEGSLSSLGLVPSGHEALGSITFAGKWARGAGSSGNRLAQWHTGQPQLEGSHRVRAQSPVAAWILSTFARAGAS